MKADAMTETAVKAVLDKVAEGYAKRDLALVLSAFAPDPDFVMYGTGLMRSVSDRQRYKHRPNATGLRPGPLPSNMDGLRSQLPVRWRGWQPISLSI